MSAGSVPRRAALLRDAPRFRRLWLSRVISCAGIGAGQVALVLLAAPSGPGMVGKVLLASALPRLLGPVAGSIADRVDQRRLLAACEAGQGAAFAVIAFARPGGTALLVLVAAAGLLAAFYGPAGKSSVPRLAPADRVAQANALLGVAFNLQVLAGPALGGLLAGAAGPTAAFAANAAAFLTSALLLTGLGPLRPDPVSAHAPCPAPGATPGAAPGGAAGRSARRSSRAVASHTWEGLRYSTGAAAPRALLTGTVLFVSFAAIDNVALVFLVKRSLRADSGAYAATVAAFGAGMMAASLALSRWGRRLPGGALLALGAVAGAAGAAATAAAGTLAAAFAAQAVAGAGNSADVAATDTLVAQIAPPSMRGRIFGAVASAAQLGSAIATGASGWLVAAAGPRGAFAVAAAGMLAGLALLRPAIRAGRAAAGQPAGADEPAGCGESRRCEPV